ncbi:MAG: hypothetical protein SGI86_10900 [Deltaproteobacteria bacterium]|nr:hypothetical protein [Deltaproteobacteria bacterium]
MAKPSARKALFASLTIAGIALAFVLAGWVSRRLFEDERIVGSAPGAASPERTLQPEANERRFRVSGVQGRVSCDQAGHVTILHAGDLLSLRDVISTAAGARIILRRGQTEIEIRENLSVAVQQIAEEAARFEVLQGSGRIQATVEGDNERLTIAGDTAEATNQGPSRWVVSRGLEGKVAVAVQKGRVRFSAAKQTVDVNEGQESSAEPNAPPIAPIGTMEELVLSVRWPEVTPGGGEVKITGQTSPTADVTVDDRRVAVSPDGKFTTTLPKGTPPGKPVEIRSQDALGREKIETGSIRTAGKAPRLAPTGEDLWKQ